MVNMQNIFDLFNYQQKVQIMFNYQRKGAKKVGKSRVSKCSAIPQTNM